MSYFDVHYFQALLILKIKIDADLAVNWSYELLEQNFDTYHLRILAGLRPERMNREETWEIVGNIVEELHIPPVSKEKAAKKYLITLLRGYLEQQFPRGKLLYELYELCLINNYDQLFYPYYLLHHEDIRTHYLPGIYYDGLEDYEEIDKWVASENEKLLIFLEQEDEFLVLQKLKDLNFSREV